MRIAIVDDLADDRTQLCRRLGGQLRSRKHDGPGIGTQSVREQVKQLGGSVEFQTEGTTFRVVVILPPAPPQGNS